MAMWSRAIAVAAFLAALYPPMVLAQVVEYVDDQGQRLHVGSNAPDRSRAGRTGSSETSRLDRETAEHKVEQSKTDKEFADEQRDAVRRKAPEKTKQVCRWAPGAAAASSNFSFSRSCN